LLVRFTLLAVACTAGLNLFETVALAVAFFVVGNFTYQSAVIFYNALLPGVAGSETRVG
jgi:MFS transporter, UMF1 family